MECLDDVLGTFLNAYMTFAEYGGCFILMCVPEDELSSSCLEWGKQLKTEFSFLAEVTLSRTEGLMENKCGQIFLHQNESNKSHFWTT